VLPRGIFLFQIVPDARFSKLDKKGGVRTPPSFFQFGTASETIWKKGGWSGGLEQIWPFQKSEYLNI
jgi:hypothetical protein